MKKGLILAMVFGVMGAVLGLSALPQVEKGLQVVTGAKNPWTHLKMNNDPDDFRFAIVSDRTGGHRPKIFSQAIQQLNLLQPEFVMSVGDLIEGYSEKPEKIEPEWKEFQSYVGKLQMPFFYVPGNHDITNAYQEQLYREKFRAPYYHFLYRNVLFLCMSSEDPPKHKKEEDPRISKGQIEYMRNAVAENSSARWIFVFLHKPLWIETDPQKSGWLDFESVVKGKNYTVFAGHVHRYQKFLRQGMKYYMLATTGGGSKLRGPIYGEFDHIGWITMKKTGPIMANIMLDGIVDDTLRIPESDEQGYEGMKNRKQVFTAAAQVTIKGQPLSEAEVSFYTLPRPQGARPSRVSDGLTNSQGAVKFSTYTAFDGTPEGEYAVVVIKRSPRFLEDGKTGPNALPVKYAKAETTPLRVTIKKGDNQFNLDLE